MCLQDDDQHLAATLAGQREGEDIRMREERVARLLDDPEKLRELRQQRAERQGRAAAEQGPALEHAYLTADAGKFGGGGDAIITVHRTTGVPDHRTSTRAG